MQLHGIESDTQLHDTKSDTQLHDTKSDTQLHGIESDMQLHGIESDTQLQLLTPHVLFHLYHGKNKLMFSEIIKRSALYLTNTLSWIFIALAH
jgi:hypothetical protein